MPENTFNMDQQVDEIRTGIEDMMGDFLMLSHLSFHGDFYESFAMPNASIKQSKTRVAELDIVNFLNSDIPQSNQIQAFANRLWADINRELLMLFSEFNHKCVPNPDKLSEMIRSNPIFQTNGLALVLNPWQMTEWLKYFDHIGVDNTGAKSFYIARRDNLHPYYRGTWKSIDVYCEPSLYENPGALFFAGKSIYFAAKRAYIGSPMFELSFDNEGTIVKTLFAKCTYNRNLQPDLGIRIV